MTEKGQNIQDEMSISCFTLGQYSIEYYDDLNEKQQLELEILRERMENRGHLAPKNYFSLNRQMLVASFSVLITYFLVLFEFKFN